MKTKSFAQILTGLLVLALGVGLMLNALNIIELGSYMRVWWPLIIVAIGVIGIVSNPRMWVWPLVMGAFGVALLLRNLGVIDINVFSLIWPTVIMLVGLSIIFHNGNWGGRKEESDDTITTSAIFSGQNLRSLSPKFKGGDVTAIFGGVDLDLRDAKIDGAAKLNVFTAFGGVDIKVPEGWTVHVTGMPIFGGWEDKTHKPSDVKNAPQLKINGTCLFGGVSVKNHKSD